MRGVGAARRKSETPVNFMKHGMNSASTPPLMYTHKHPPKRLGQLNENVPFLRPSSNSSSDLPLGLNLAHAEREDHLNRTNT